MGKNENPTEGTYRPWDDRPRNMEEFNPENQERMNELTDPTDFGDVQKAYRVEELTTEGWSLVDPKAQQLPRDKAKDWLDYMLREGRPPNSLRAVPERPVRENIRVVGYEEKLNKPNPPQNGNKNVTINVDKDVNVTINET
mgnify:CR=1 FL=1